MLLVRQYKSELSGKIHNKQMTDCCISCCQRADIFDCATLIIKMMLHYQTKTTCMWNFQH